MRGVAAAALVAIAGIEAAYGLVLSPFALGGYLDATYSAPVAGFRTVILLGATVLLPLGIAAATCAAAAGIASGSRAGWWLGFLASLTWLGTGCAPLAALPLGILVGVPEIRALALSSAASTAGSPASRGGP